MVQVNIIHAPGHQHQTGLRAKAAHAAIQAPWATLHASIAAGTASPPVVTPAVPPAAATQATQAALHPVWHTPYTANPANPASDTRTRLVRETRTRISFTESMTVILLCLYLVQCVDLH